MFRVLWLNLNTLFAQPLNVNFLIDFKYFFVLGLLSLSSSCILLFWSLKQVSYYFYYYCFTLTFMVYLHVN